MAEILEQHATTAIVSSIPPPFGGVTVHVERLSALLGEHGFSFRIYEQQGKSIPERNVVPLGRASGAMLKFLLTVPEPIVHLHTSSVSAIGVCLAILLWRKKKVLLTLHGEKPMRDYQGIRFPGVSLLLTHLLRKAHIIAVSESIATWLRDIGVDDSRLSVVPAFLPPSESQLLERNIPKVVLEFAASHELLVGSQGWFGYFINGRHVYSFEMLLELIASICKERNDVGFYTVISGTYDQEHRKSIFAKRHTMGLDSKWLIIEDNFHAAALFKKSDLFVRPTITDGDAVSVRECLWLGVPVVASDAVQRPEGCVIHGNLDLKSLAECVTRVLCDVDEHRRRVEAIEIKDSTSDILDVYRRIIAEV
ncbi:MAG: glycosyltransferase family 4 protein [Pirellulaceae bacterium]